MPPETWCMCAGRSRRQETRHDRVMIDPTARRRAPEMSRAGRHRPGLAAEPAGGLSPAADGVEARLLGQPRSMRPREVSARASLSRRSARMFWSVIEFPIVVFDDTVFTETDVLALQAVAGLVR